MSLVLPTSVPVEGTRRAVFIEGGVADKENVTVSEVESGDDISCYITTTGVNLSEDQAVIVDGRLCSSQDLEAPGRDSVTLELQYVYNLDTPASDEARLGLTRGTAGTIVLFYQKSEDEDDYQTGDWYRAVDVSAGKQRPMPVEQNAMDRIAQKMFVRSKVTDFCQLVSGS